MGVFAPKTRKQEGGRRRCVLRLVVLYEMTVFALSLDQLTAVCVCYCGYPYSSLQL
jgi:hypothetical protein